MNEVFADSGYWIAILVPGDQHRESAYRAVASLESARIVTTEMVLTEVFATISRRGRESRLLAMVLLDDLKNDPNITIIPQTHEQFDAAAQFFARRMDQRYSLTDCASFLVMEERGIQHALAHDTDFRTAGFIPMMG